MKTLQKPSQTRYPVIIVGGGPVGTVLAYDLARRGIGSLVVDFRFPNHKKFKAGSCNIRSMEHLRRMGAADVVSRAFPPVPGYDLDVAFVTALDGYELHRFEHCLGWGPNDFSPVSTQLIPQQHLVWALRRDIAKRFPVAEFVDGWRVDDIWQDEATASLRITRAETGEELVVSGDYAVGCDGGGSVVRKQIGSVLEGQGGRAENVSIMFDAPLLPQMTTIRHAQQFWIVTDSVDVQMLWGRHYQYDDDNELIFWKTTPEIEKAIRAEPEAFVHRAVGFEFPLTVTSIDPWRTHQLVADKWRVGRVFLAGDAAHLHPPTGGLGLNTGIGDVADLGWKIAATMQGWGGAALLDSYEPERHTLASRVVGQANWNYDSGSPRDYYEPGIADDTPEGEAIRRRVGAKIFADKNDEFNAPGLVLGYRYRQSPIVIDDGAPPPEETVVEFRPSAHPGCRLPHSIQADGAPIFDKLIDGVNLVVVGGLRAGEEQPVQRAAEARGVPFAVVTAQVELRALYGARLLLVRPDQHVAWRGNALPADAQELIDAVTGRLESRLPLARSA